MNKIVNLFKLLFAIYGALVFATIMFILLPFLLLSALFGRSGHVFGFKLLKLWSYLYKILTFLRISIVRSPKLEKGKSYIYVGNHASFLDAIIVPLSVYGAVMPLGKKELGQIPILGLVFKRFAVLVDRGDKGSRRKSVGVLSKLAERGDSIFIFPEGTMNRTDQILQPFYNGAFRIAMETGLPIVPMVLHNAGKLLPPSNKGLRPGKVEVEIGAPLDPKDHTAVELHDLSRQWILERLEAKQVS